MGKLGEVLGKEKKIQVNYEVKLWFIFYKKIPNVIFWTVLFQNVTVHKMTSVQFNVT